MANESEIKNRIKSIQDTMKITKAMYMISSTKLQKARKSLENTEPFFYAIQGEIRRVLRHIPDFEHNYFDNRDIDQNKPVRTIGYIVVTADKGMAGAYNHNVLKKAEELIGENTGASELFVVGELGRQYFTAKGVPITEQFHYTAQNPTMHRARTMAQRIMELYDTEGLDEVYVIYTHMVNSMTSEVRTTRILPLKREDFGGKLPGDAFLNNYQEEFFFLPSATDVIEHIVPNYVTGFLYGAMIESYSSEQNARMQAMQTATQSAEAMLHELSIEYNRLRQSAITQEITEVIGGAKALKRKKGNV